MDKEDRISLLPDGLLLNIISRIKIKIFNHSIQKKEQRLMSTKEVIKTTSTISKRWQHLWTLLPNLIFIDYPGTGVDMGTKYRSFIDKTLTQCPTDVKLNKFKLHILYGDRISTSQVNSWIRHAIMRKAQEIDFKILDGSILDEQFSYDNKLFFNNSWITIMGISNCLFNPPNSSIRWDKLRCLCISKGELDGDLVGKIISGSPCLETLELNNCHTVNFASFFKNFEVIRLTCHILTYKRLTDDSYDGEYMSMKLSRCEFNPHNMAIRWDKLKFLCISYDEIDESLIQKIFSGSPCLESLELDQCYGVRRIDISSRRFKNLVLTNYGDMCPEADYIEMIEINAPYMLSLTIKKYLYLEKLLLLNMSSLVKADLDYMITSRFADRRGRPSYDIREEMLRGLLPSLGHVNEITLGDDCFKDLSRLSDKGFQLSRGRDDNSHVEADADEDRITELFVSESKKRADAAAAKAKRFEKSQRKINLMQMQKQRQRQEKQRQRQEKKLDKGESDDDMGLMSLFD